MLNKHWPFMSFSIVFDFFNETSYNNTSIYNTILGKWCKIIFAKYKYLSTFLGKVSIYSQCLYQCIKLDKEPLINHLKHHFTH